MLDAKKVRATAMIAEVEDANKRAIQVKDQRKKEEKDLEQKIIDYNRAKAQREEEKAADAIKTSGENKV